MTDQTEDTQKLMRRIAASLVSWLTFEQSALRYKMYSEYWMYTPVFELASARGWKIEPECEVVSGRRQRIDFMFYGDTKKYVDNNRLAAVEISYIQKASPRNKVPDDEKKLQALKGSDFKGGTYGTLRRYVLIAAKKDNLKRYCRNNLTRALPLFKVHDDNLGYIFESPAYFKSPWCVMVLAVGAKSPKKKKA